MIHSVAPHLIYGKGLPAHQQNRQTTLEVWLQNLGEVRGACSDSPEAEKTC